MGTLRDKGTNRGSFYRREANKYEWLDIGSSYVLSDRPAAFLLAQRLIRRRRGLHHFCTSLS
jgi:dTDP-4-amino-4,6-dideoxygalactose transaminase